MARTANTLRTNSKAPGIPGALKAGTKSDAALDGTFGTGNVYASTPGGTLQTVVAQYFKLLTQLQQPPSFVLLTRHKAVNFDQHIMPTYRDTGNRLRELLGLSLECTADVLGVSRSTASKETPVTVDSLDRVHSLAVNLARAQAVFGDDAVAWFTTPHPALGGLSPLELQRTRYGERELTTFIQNMLDGAFI